jgi:uncharacterized protein (TIGR00255 family)
MTDSMTAFARREEDTAFGTLSVEIRSVNHRYLEPTFRQPDTLKPVEMPLREALKKQVKRGKVDVQLRFYPNQASAGLDVNVERLQALNGALLKVRDTVLDSPMPDALALLQYPGILAEEAVDMEAVFTGTRQLFDSALTDFMAHRRREGDELGKMISERLDEIDAIVDLMREEMPGWVASFRETLNAKAAQFQVDLDPDRLEQEVVILAQKADVAEELDRLVTHTREVRHILKQKGAIGRRLDFLMQEFNREANTLGSKATNSRVTQASVDLKVLIEQMREQVQNIE